MISSSEVIFCKTSSISNVSSNSALIIWMITSFDTWPSLSGDPPRATKASKYSSASFSCSLSSSNYFRWVSTAISMLKSTLVAFFSSKNSFNWIILGSERLYPHAIGQNKWLEKTNIWSTYSWATSAAQIIRRNLSSLCHTTGNFAWRSPYRVCWVRCIVPCLHLHSPFPVRYLQAFVCNGNNKVSISSSLSLKLA